MRKDFCALALVRTNTERSAEVIEDDCRVGKRARQVGQLRNLRVVQPRVETQAALGELPESVTKRGIEQKPLGRVGVRLPHRSRRIPCSRVPNSLKPQPYRDVRIEHFADSRTEREIREADDASGDANRSIASARGHRRNAVDKLGLADWFHRARPVSAIHRRAFDEHRRDHVVARARIEQQFVEQIPAIRVVP
jgi:hypothetical protein